MRPRKNVTTQVSSSPLGNKKLIQLKNFIDIINLEAEEIYSSGSAIIILGSIGCNVLFYSLAYFLKDLDLILFGILFIIVAIYFLFVIISFLYLIFKIKKIGLASTIPVLVNAVLISIWYLFG